MPPHMYNIKLQFFLAIERLRLIMCEEGNGAIRLLIALGSLTWFVLLIDPTMLFNNSPVKYSVMRAIAAEETWAIGFAISGFIGLMTVLLGIKSRTVLITDALLASILWTTSTIACFAAHWPAYPISFLGQLMAYAPPAAMSGELWLSVAAWWCLIRRIIEVKLDCVF